MKELQKSTGQGMPQSLVRDRDRNSVPLVLADSRLQQVNLENTMARRELEAPKSVWRSGLQDSPVLSRSPFFSSLITQMLRCVTVSPELKKE